MRSSRRFLATISLLLAMIAIILAILCWSNKITTIILVRHAERLDDSANTDLSSAGTARAEALANTLSEASIDSIYTTNFCRTAQTAQPLAARLALPLIVQQSNNLNAGLENCSPTITVPINNLPLQINSVSNLVSQILEDQAGQEVLILGHSSTVPQILHELTGQAFTPIKIGHDEYDNLFVVMVSSLFGSPKLIKAKYGE